MIAGVKMRVLGVFLLAVLGCSLAGARIVNKCELRQEIMKVAEKAQQAELSGEDFVAKTVCYAKLVSDFNTSAVDVRRQEEGHLTKVQPPSPTPHTEEKNSKVPSFCGIFQLSSHTCGRDCKELTDDNIHDDIECLLKIFISLIDEGFNFVTTHWEDCKRVIKPVLERCGDVQASEYFAECK